MINNKNYSLLILGFCLCFFQSTANAKADYQNLQPLDHVIANLIITSGSSDHVKTGAKLLYGQAPENNTLIYDLAALKLSQLGTTYPDTNAWLIKAISRLPSKRYLAFLENTQAVVQSQNKTEENEIRQSKNDKVLKYLKKAIKEINQHPDAEPFLTEDFNYEEIYNTILATNSQIQQHDRDIESPDIGASLETLYQTLGPPNEIGLQGKNRQIRIPIGIYASETIDILITNVSLTYNGYRIYEIAYSDGKNAINKIKFLPPAEEISISNELDQADTYELARTSVIDNLAASLPNADAPETLDIAKNLIKRRRYNEENLNIVADKIWREKETQDDVMISALAHLLRYIGESKQPRYYQFVSDVHKTAEYRAIRKHAKRAMEYTSEGAEDTLQYKPSS